MILRDPVHGLISFEAHGVVARLMDTREVQRLRRIRALGHASVAFPGAEHSRFAHAVGSAHVMQRYLDRVRSLASDIPASDRIDDDMAQVALAAALLHDVGHGPFSHTFEAVLPDGRAHEEWTSSIILDPGTEVHAALRSLDPTAPELVERLVHGRSPIRHLARAVSGTFDVDRCDYLLRDSYMTGVRYGLLDLDWLLTALRLYLPPGDTAAALAVDGEKGLTAVEGFFLNRLYMYRQVYLHKAVRAADAVSRALFMRLRELGPQPGTPPALEALLRGEQVTTGEFLQLDDAALQEAIRRHAEAGDPVLRELAQRQRDRRLFKSMRLSPEVPQATAQARLDALLREAGHDPRYAGCVDRVEIDAYIEDEALMVLSSRGRLQRLLDASPVMHGLSRETFVHYRVLFPGELRERAASALADLR
ncbi:HD domain-containing protein [Paraliomyxa miuraensis]|uniref:HD domain-containing protein n=1 Tax=Paraliomyxa miuraensis TaxID=376150 RepID=UPI002251C477|nr:HD domain-containing protein [Paraliomyxa miuraensis]MCX4248021.1 HD domain-containing protein [Paraliomyxa miuraensis]